MALPPDQRRQRARQLHGQGYSYAAIARELECAVQTARRDCIGLGLPKNPRSQRARNDSMRNATHNQAKLAQREAQAFALRLQGLPYTEIARQMGYSPANVRLWVNTEIERRIGPAVEQLREVESARLDELTRRAWEVMEANDGELRLKAIDRLLQIARRRAALLGLDSPVRVDAVITERSQADAEMEELLRELDARNAVIEGEVVGSADTPA